MRKINYIGLGFAVTCVLGLATQAQADISSIYGKWVPVEYQCTNQGYPSDSVFSIDSRQVSFFESSCDIIGAQYTGVGSAYSVTMSCSGEGDSWQNTAIYARTDTGLLVYFSDGYGYMAKACR